MEEGWNKRGGGEGLMGDGSKEEGWRKRVE